MIRMRMLSRRTGLVMVIMVTMVRQNALVAWLERRSRTGKQQEERARNDNESFHVRFLTVCPVATEISRHRYSLGSGLKMPAVRPERHVHLAAPIKGPHLRPSWVRLPNSGKFSRGPTTPFCGSRNCASLTFTRIERTS